MTPSTIQQGRGVAGAVMMKKGIHPEWYPEAKVRKQRYDASAAAGRRPLARSSASVRETELLHGPSNADSNP